jgi:hypothetical protein
MFIAVKIILYLIAAHVFYNAGFTPENKLMDFTVLMSIILLMDIISYFFSRFSTIREFYEEEEE